jgi:hypothetical protein
MKDVDTGGGPSDGHIDNKVMSEQEAIEKIKHYKNSNVAYFWCG